MKCCIQNFGSETPRKDSAWGFKRIWMDLGELGVEL
jgi:hypothetical protein